MQVKILSFSEFDLETLYKVLQLRTAVFVVEQDCVYQDLDGKDQKATHIIGIENDEIVAYSRYFNAGDYFKNPSIGRVVVNPDYRGKNYGKKIMEASIAYAKELSENQITISAQCYLDKFYTELGFKKTGKEYLEDGIPHQEMILKQ